MIQVIESEAYVGSKVRLRVRFVDVDTSSGVDPDSVVLFVSTPLRTRVFEQDARTIEPDQYAYPGTVVREAPGVYHVNLRITASGTWRWRWLGVFADHESVIRGQIEARSSAW